jgi:hypothetical protein
LKEIVIKLAKGTYTRVADDDTTFKFDNFPVGIDALLIEGVRLKKTIQRNKSIS